VLLGRKVNTGGRPPNLSLGSGSSSHPVEHGEFWVFKISVMELAAGNHLLIIVAKALSIQ
jgi:hypothetical protein